MATPRLTTPAPSRPTVYQTPLDGRTSRASSAQPPTIAPTPVGPSHRSYSSRDSGVGAPVPGSGAELHQLA